VKSTYYANREIIQFVLILDSVNATLIDVSELFERIITQPIIISTYINTVYIDIGEVFERSVNQVMTLTDTVLRQPIYNRQPVQLIIINNTIKQTYYANRYIQQPVIISNTVNRVQWVTRGVEQAIVVVDSINSLYIYAGVLYIRSVSQAIAVTDVVVRDFIAGVNYFITGYVQNTLELPLQNARIDYSGGHTYTDGTGYYTASIPSGERTILGRAIGYMNSSNTTVINANMSINFTLGERKTPVKTPGFEFGTILISLVTLLYLYKRSKRNK
jgi:hypothetical protein